MSKKLRIGVLLNAAYSDYGAAIVEGIAKFCRENDCIQIVFPVMREFHNARFNFHYDAMLKLVNPTTVDVLCICTATFVNSTDINALKRELNELPSIPKISIGMDVPSLPSVVVDSSKAISSLVEHVIVDHKRKNFLLLQSGETSAESQERSYIFKSTLKKNNIPFNEDKKLCGNFNFEDAYAELNKYIRKKEKIDFDAIFCCNDDMALGCIGCLEDNDIHVPEDVSVIGYDNVFASRAQDFGISTVDQLIERQGEVAAKMAVDLFKNGKLEPRLNIVEAVPVYRRTCGCRKIEKKDDENYEAIKKLLKHNIHYNSSVQIYMLHFFLSESQIPVTLEKLYTRLSYCFSLFDIKNASLVLYDKPVYYKANSSFVVPEKAVVKMVYTTEKGISTPDVKFNPAEHMLPENYSEILSDNQFVFPIFAEFNQYGYFVMKIGQYEKIFYQTVFELISKEIVSSLKITQAENERAKLKDKNISLEEYSEHLSLLSRTDELTQILNRRGFYEAAQVTIERHVSLGKGGLVIYGDMDGLKVINDTFGHEAGDRAIKAEADILTDIFRSCDIVGRLGGDEFAILAPDLTLKDFSSIKKRLDEKCNEYNKKELEPFVLSMSIGCTDFSEYKVNLDKLLNEADGKLYEEKRKKKQKNQ